MAISINWLTKVITVPQSFLTLVGGAVYQLDVDAFRLALKDLEDSEEGMCFPDTHRHNTQVVLSGVTYARFFEMINGYTITFEDVGSPYTVNCVGANHNIADVKNVNQVSLIVGNSAGLIVTSTGGSGASASELWGYANRSLTTPVSVSGVPQVNTVQISGVPVSIADFNTGSGVSGGVVDPTSIWSYANRSLTQPVSISGVPDVNVVQVSGEYVSPGEGIIDANLVLINGFNLGSASGIINANILQVSGVPVSIASFNTGSGMTGGSVDPSAVWSYTNRSLTQAVSISGVPAVNTVQISGVPVTFSTLTDVNVTHVSGIPVSIKDLQGEAAGLTPAAIWEYTNRTLTDNTAERIVAISGILNLMAPLLIGTVEGAGTDEEIYRYGGRTVKVYATPEGNVTNVVFE